MNAGKKSQIQIEVFVLSFRRTDTNLMFADDLVERKNVLTIKITVTVLEISPRYVTSSLLCKITQLEKKWTNKCKLLLLEAVSHL